MALIKCPECNNQVSSNAVTCPHCGNPLQSTQTSRQDASVKISCPVCPGQIFNNNCIAYDDDTGKELAKCKQGETLIFRLSKPTTVRVVVKGSFGQPTEIMHPGDRYKIAYRGFGKVYLAKVDAIF